MKTARAYKLFKVKKNSPHCLFPLYVLADKPTPMGVWLPAECGEKADETHTKSKMGALAYRPGWHCSPLPYATHIGVKGSDGVITQMHPDTVWCEVQYSAEKDYQSICEERSKAKHNGKFIPRDACLDFIPENGYYTYKTNPNMFGEWVIAGAIFVERVLTDEEVEKIAIDHHLTPIPRSGGRLNLADYGF